jgi:hypothetical protein
MPFILELFVIQKKNYVSHKKKKVSTLSIAISLLNMNLKYLSLVVRVDYR